MNHSDSNFQKKGKQKESDSSRYGKKFPERIRNIKRKWVKTTSLIEENAKLSGEEEGKSCARVIDEMDNAFSVKSNGAKNAMFKQEEKLINPPSFVPPYPPWQNGSKGIADCLFCYTYIWQFNGMNYWFYPIVNSSRTVSGLIWSRKRWSHHLIHHYSIRAHYRYK